MMRRIFAAIAMALAFLLKLPFMILRGLFSNGDEPVRYAEEAEAVRDEWEADMRGEEIARQLEEDRKLRLMLLDMKGQGLGRCYDPRELEADLDHEAVPAM